MREAGVENWQGQKLSSFFLFFATSWRRVGMGGYWIGSHVTLSLKEKQQQKCNELVQSKCKNTRKYKTRVKLGKV